MELSEIRENIDRIDTEIVELLNQRFEFVEKVGEWKKGQNSAIYVPEREKSLLERLEKLNRGKISNQVLKAVYREVMAGAKALEKDLSIAFLGPEASFSQLAALAKFGDSVSSNPKNSISDVFKDIETGRSDYGCVPIENSTEGAVNHTLDMFINSNVKICSEINMAIHHNLLSNTPAKDIKKIYSHAQILGQCRSWLLENYPNAEQIEMPSSAAAAKLASIEDGSAAIASKLAAQKYDLDILLENIEDNGENTTRFMILGKQDTVATGDDKTSICFSTNNKVGALYDSLLPFKEEGITLSFIESRPSKRVKWEYYFFVDLTGHISDEKVKKAIGKLEGICQFVKILGSYPKSNNVV